MKEAFQRVPTPLALRRMRPGGATRTVADTPNTRAPQEDPGGKPDEEHDRRKRHPHKPEAAHAQAEQGTGRSAANRRSGAETAKNQGTSATCLQ
ncbi:hypothetical protein [Streptomyces sp. NPDC029041]|uniref:hypothetical protein n=1 Tax=Streptomyces sp. NPDC029041 TaxID=3155727 RepID=UPI0033CD8FB5